MDWHTNTYGDLSCTWNDGPFTLTATVKNDDLSLEDMGDLGSLVWNGREPGDIRFGNLGLEPELDTAARYNNWWRNMPSSYKPSSNYPEDTPENREYWRRDARRLLRYGWAWNYVFVCVVATLDGTELGSSSLGGIESDAGEECFTEIAEDCAIEALSEARTELIRLAEAACAAGLFPVAPMYLASE